MNAHAIAFTGCRIVGIVFLVQGLGSGRLSTILDSMFMSGHRPGLEEWLMLGAMIFSAIVGFFLWGYAMGLATLISGTTRSARSRFEALLSQAMAPAVGWIVLGLATWRVLDLISLERMPKMVAVEVACLTVLGAVGVALIGWGKLAFVPSGGNDGV